MNNNPGNMEERMKLLQVWLFSILIDYFDNEKKIYCIGFHVLSIGINLKQNRALFGILIYESKQIEIEILFFRFIFNRH